MKTLEELRYWEFDCIVYIYVDSVNGQWLYSPARNPEVDLRSLKEDLENETVQYSRPPDLEELLGMVRGAEQNLGGLSR